MDRRRFLQQAGSASAAAAAGVSLFGGSLLHAPAAATPLPADRLSLAGDWGFKLDPKNIGREYEKWYDRTFSSQIELPGSTDEAGYGTETTGPEFGHFSREWRYSGLAWYQKEVEVPADWDGKRITLFLERCHWATQVWVGAQDMGRQNSLCVPHVYDLTEALEPGRTHRLTMVVDNRYLIPVGVNAHSVTDHTQTNWNGVIGRVELQATDPVWLDDVTVYPQVEDGAVRVEGTVGNITGQSVDSDLDLAVYPAEGDDGGAPVQQMQTAVSVSGEMQDFEATVPLDDAERWNEVEPALYEVEAQLSARAGGEALSDTRTEPLGMRSLSAEGTRLQINDRPLYLRGTLECCIFPKTGHPPTDVEEWARLYRTARGYGLNHFRFHSWTPPEAAFVAADRAGFLLQVELPVWSHAVGEDEDLTEFMRAEGRRIQETYGNHPSFALMSLGNEMDGDWDFMNGLLEELKQRDARHLYSAHADHRGEGPEPNDQFYIGHNIDGDWMRLHSDDTDYVTSPFERRISLDEDFASAAADLPVPTVAHELGQWVVNPAYDHFDEFTGPIEPRNLAAFRDELAANGMLDQAEVMQQATGKFSQLLYKEEIERALRTPDYGGFQLLQLQDFPGQGEALIGFLDSFWDSKGIVSGEEFRRFCSPTVPLMRMEKGVWTTGETFRATAQVHHYGRDDLQGVEAMWALRDPDGAELASGRLDPTDVPVGSVTTLGEVAVPLGAMGEEARHVTAELRLPDTPGPDAEDVNTWDVWVYPEEAPTSAPGGDVLVTTHLDEEARGRLDDGGDVLVLSPPEETDGAHALDAHFLPVYWSLLWFPDVDGTSSVLCDPEHPALAQFPTQFHSNWQWQELMYPSKAFILNDTAEEYRPLVQLIDDFHRNHKLGSVIETRMGEGRLLATGLNLGGDRSDRPAARQMLHSLKAYMASDSFRPEYNIDADLLDSMLA
jgi:hypothetical protein